MRERATVWIELAGKQRPAVVLEVRPDLVRVAYGRHEEEPGWDGPAVPRGTRAGRKFPLRDPVTYFYGANTAWLPPIELSAGEADCTRDLFDEIRRVVEAHDARVTSDE